MNSNWDSVFYGMSHGDYGIAPTNFPALALGLLLAFAMGHLIAWVYMLTHSGLSYSRSFVNALVIMPTIVALVMNVLSNNLVTAFGMMAVFAIVRFRNILRDTLDTSYILCVLVVVLEDTDRAMKRLRPMASKVHGIAFDLTQRDAIKRATDVAVYA